MKREKAAKDVKSYVQFQLHRNVINLYKGFFSIMEDVVKEQESFIESIEQTHGIDVSDLNHLNKFKQARIRKKILDLGNDTLRDLDKNFELIDITLQSDKLNLLKFSKQVQIEENLEDGDKNIKVKGKIL